MGRLSVPLLHFDKVVTLSVCAAFPTPTPSYHVAYSAASGSCCPKGPILKGQAHFPATIFVIRAQLPVPGILE